MMRAILLAALLAAYGVVCVGVPSIGRGSARFDPLAPRAHTVEALIVARHFTQALPLATELQRNYPDEGQPLEWLATIHRGLGQFDREAAAWEAFLKVSPAPASACPWWPEAYARSDRAGQALRAY